MYGFLHVVLNGNEGSEGLRSSELKLDLEDVNKVPLYDPGFPAKQWSNERTRIDKEYPIIVFSKVSLVTYILISNVKDLTLF